MKSADYIIAFVISAALAFGITLVIRKLALRRGIVDRPEFDRNRKIHTQPTPLLGGLAIYLAVLLVVVIYATVCNKLLGGYLLSKHLLGVLIGGAIIMFGGYLDDRYRLSPAKQIIFPILASLVIVGSGIGVAYISNPLGNVIRLDTVKLELFTWQGLPYSITLFSDLFTVVWLMGMMYTTKFLDGLDGLSAGIATIGSLIIFCLSLTQTVAQPETALLAIIFVGAGAGFLLLNFNPAKIFLGEGGSVFVGFFLGVLSIISGAKIATALLIMGIPILDTVWVILRRLFWEKRSIVSADKKHLHFRLLDIGLTQRQAVVFLYVLTAVFGFAGLLVTGKGKLITLFILLAVMVVLALILVLTYRRKKSRALTENIR
ncbi:MAG: MraY family glycosyltransferase [Patescibacteria group bacterium]|nr:MraY family glycosyltransferase [Patescibacteria group bacterium]